MLIIQNVTWLNPEDNSLTHGTLRVEQGPFGGVEWVEAQAAQNAAPHEVFDAKGLLATRAFAIGHHHIYSALSRGMPPAKAPTNTFLEILENIWWRLDKNLDEEMVQASALAAAIQAARAGTSFIIDHHSAPFTLRKNGPSCLETIAQVFEKVGLGHLLCYELSCRDGQNVVEQGLADTEHYLSSGRKGHVGLHASFTVDNSLLQKAADLAQKYNTGLHIHVAESAYDETHCRATYGVSVMERLAATGMLDTPKTLLGHCVHLEKKERALLSASACYVVSCVESNLNNNVGLGHYADLPRVILGTDGLHGDMLRSAQYAYFCQGLAEGKANTHAILKRLQATHDHIAAHHAPGDSANNMVFFAYPSPTPFTSQNAEGHIFYGLQAAYVHSLICQGKFVLKNNKFQTIDEKAALAFANEQAQRLWAKMA